MIEICNCCEKIAIAPLYHPEEGDAYCGECVASLLGSVIQILQAGLEGIVAYDVCTDGDGVTDALNLQEMARDALNRAKGES